MHKDELASLVSFHRKKAKLTQIQLAELAGVSRTVIQHLEAGRGKTVWDHVEKILHVLNLELKPSGPLVEQWLKTRGERP
jgi:HTH-type transcriptional regulator/antitoxin HipB